jgi:hypothetical protein
VVRKSGADNRTTSAISLNVRWAARRSLAR